jgi:hypothetical protein
LNKDTILNLAAQTVTITNTDTDSELIDPPLTDPTLSPLPASSRKRKHSITDDETTPLPPLLSSPSTPAEAWSTIPPPPLCFLPWGQKSTTTKQSMSCRRCSRHVPHYLLNKDVRRFIIQQSLAPLTRWEKTSNKISSTCHCQNKKNENSVSPSSSSYPYGCDSEEDECDSSISDYDSDSDWPLIRSKLNEAESEWSGKRPIRPELNQSITNKSDHFSVTMLGTPSTPNSCVASPVFTPPSPNVPISPYSPAPVSPFRHSPVATTIDSSNLIVTLPPRILLTTADSYGIEEIRSYPCSVLRFWERAGLRPFNPSLPGAFPSHNNTNSNTNMFSSFSTVTSSMNKNILYLALAPARGILDVVTCNLDKWAQNIGTIYESGGLGKCTPLLSNVINGSHFINNNAPLPATVSHSNRSCVLSVRYVRPNWLLDARPPSPQPLLSSPSPTRPDGSPSPTPSPILHDSYPTTIPLDFNVLNNPLTSNQYNTLPPLLSVWPSRDGSQRYYQACVWSILQQVSALVHNREVAAAGIYSGSGSLLSSHQSSNIAPSRALPIDLERYDTLLLYVVSPEGGLINDSNQTNTNDCPPSIPLLTHYLGYLTDGGARLLSEVRALQNQQIYNYQQNSTNTTSTTSTSYEYLFREADKDNWSQALSILAHIHIVVHVVNESVVTAQLTPSNLRARALTIYSQASRLTDKVSLFSLVVRKRKSYTCSIYCLCFECYLFFCLLT